MKRTKLFTAIFAIVMVVAMLAMTACGGNKGGDTPAPAGSGSGEAPAAGGKIIIGATLTVSP